MPFEEKEYDVQKAIARHEGLPFLYKRAEITSQPIANPVPLAETSGYTAGGDDIETTLNNAPSAIGTGKSSNIDDLDDGAMAISIEGDPEMIDNDFIENIEDVLQSGSIEDIFEHIVKQLGEVVNKSENHEKTKKDSAAHKVEKDGEKFYVVEDGNEKAAGPFDSQEEAYARANELNDLENLETEETHKEAKGKCECWNGYERVPGTKPCAPGSCRKCDDHRKKESSVTPAMAKARRLIASKNCKCWEGYKRVPGTKPCAPGSCEKCDSHSKKSAIKFSDETNDRIEAIWNQAVKIAKVQNPNIDESLKNEVIFSCLGKSNFNDITPEMMAEKIIEKSNQAVIAKVAELGYNTKVGSQGDKPSPNAAKAVFDALCSNNESKAKELLKMTDCPEGCEVHAEGKCNHGYMSAGRTRVRYLVNDSSFDKSEDSKGAEAPVDEPLEIKE
jgi:hypothetical protein